MNLILLLSLSLVLSSSQASRKSEVVRYLDQIYDQAQELGRPLVNGEMNLLPEGVEGFANSVRCFYDTSTFSVFNNSRNLLYNLSSLTLDSKIQAIRLVYKKGPNMQSYHTHLHEVTRRGEDTDLKLLDSGISSGEWHTMIVQNVVDSMDNDTGKRLYNLMLSVSNDNNSLTKDLLETIQPMLMVYSNDIDNIGGTESTEEDSNPSQRRKREIVGGADEEESGVVVVPSLEELKTLSCRRHVRTMQFSQLGWPGSRYIVTIPREARFSFCYGTCDSPLEAETSHQYSNHATIVGLASPELAGAGLSPCCVPKNTRAIRVVFESKINSHMMYMRSMPDVTSCQCS